MSAERYELTEEQRQLVIQSLADNSLLRPGFYEALRVIAEVFFGAEMLEQFRELDSDQVLALQPWPETLGGRLRRCRHQKRETLRSVEGATLLSNAVISQIENGQVKNPGLFTIAKLAKHYGTTIDHLLEGLADE